MPTSYQSKGGSIEIKEKYDSNDKTVAEWPPLTSFLEDFRVLTPSFDTSFLNTVSNIYIFALKYAGYNFESVFASILPSENGAYPLH